MTPARSAVRFHSPDREGFGYSWSWSRTIGGQLYSFTYVIMPSGEVRWNVSKFNGYVGGPAWGCAWSPLRSWTFQ